MLSDPAAEDPGFTRAVAGVAHLVAYAGLRGLSSEVALAGTGLDPADLRTPGLEVTATQELRVVRTLRARLGEVGADVGAGYRVATFGVLGYAILSGRTLGEAMDVALRFLDLSFTFALPRAEAVGDRVVVTVEGAHLPDDVRRFCVERDTVAIVTVLDALVPGGVGATTHLGADRATLTFLVAELDRPLVAGGAGSLAVAESLCADVVGRRRARTGLAQDVRVLITQTLPAGAPMAGVAAGLGLSERTLRRQLRAEGTGYQELLDEVRSSLARELLDGRATMPVAEVATRLGYARAGVLVRAHRRWTGRTPTQGGPSR